MVVPWWPLLRQARVADSRQSQSLLLFMVCVMNQHNVLLAQAHPTMLKHLLVDKFHCMTRKRVGAHQEITFL